MAVRRDEVETAVHPGVIYVLSVDPTFILVILGKLLVNVFFYGPPAVRQNVLVILCLTGINYYSLLKLFSHYIDVYVFAM